MKPWKWYVGWAWKAPKRTFTCAVCKRTFEKGWSDEEALAELKENFPGVTAEQCEVACDDCWKRMQGLGIE